MLFAARVDSRSFVHPAVMPVSVCAEFLYASDAIHNSLACVVVAVVPETMVVEVVGDPAVSPFAVLSTGLACHPFVALHSSIQIYMECEALNVQVHDVSPACVPLTIMYHMLVSMVALPPAGWLIVACVHPLGPVMVVLLLPHATEATTKLPSVIPLASVIACDVPVPDELTWLL
ncbi:hypothetical protein KSF_096060 [Reticulibacter mediterranei]|uniref:Uncharacterized protein n=1 Tax=Reticulibacter mediterranei TaxID=2778369 RepID=A0A8J3ISD5_9CHLR|nr:hypothetical protein KSF_096060 [Reticulibacter mediterranei]